MTEIDLSVTQEQDTQVQNSLKEVVIDKVELVYFAYDLSHGSGFDLSTSPGCNG